MLEKYTFDGKKTLELKEIPTNAKEDGVEKAEIKKKMKKNLETMQSLQEKLYADSKEGIIVVLQALDAAGKDSAIRHVMTVLNPQGMQVKSFKAPNAEELAHDYLWRIHANVPEKGGIAIFNRSHYEDVVAVQVRGLRKHFAMAERIREESDKDFFKKRYEQIKDFETYLYDNSYRVVKIFLNVSMKKQKERFLERIDRQEKNWKFDVSDIEDRALFAEYQKTYEEAINRTATKECPWYVLPADQKWYTRYLISEIMVRVMTDCDPQFPQVSEDTLRIMKEARVELVEEK